MAERKESPAAIASDCFGSFRRPDIEAPLAVWEYAFALERRVTELNDTLLRIGHWPFDVNVKPESDLRAIKEEALRYARP